MPEDSIVPVLDTFAVGTAAGEHLCHLPDIFYGVRQVGKTCDACNSTHGSIGRVAVDGLSESPLQPNVGHVLLQFGHWQGRTPALTRIISRSGMFRSR